MEGEELNDPNYHLNDLNHEIQVSKCSMWMFPNRPIPRVYKQSQHVRASWLAAYPWLINSKTVFRFRLIATLALWCQMLFNTVYEFLGWHMIQLQYMTIDGLYLTAVTFTFLFIGHFRFKEESD